MKVRACPLPIVALLLLPLDSSPVALVNAGDCSTWTHEKTIRKKVEDTLIRQDVPSATAGEDTFLTIDLQDPQQTQVLIKFRKLKLPKDAALYDARLSLFAMDPSCCGARISGYRMFIPWSEADASWQNPFFSGVFLGADTLTPASFEFDASVSKQFVTVDVTSDVEYWLKTGAFANDGWVLLSNSGDGFDFYSSEWKKKKKRPKVVLRYCFPDSSSASSDDYSPPSTPVMPPSTVGIGSGSCNSVTQLAFGGGGIDTLLFEEDPSRSGKDEQLLTANVKNNDQGECQVLLQFPGIPESAHKDTVVEKAQLEFYIAEDSVGPVHAHRMTTPWTEDATWKFFGWGVSWDGGDAVSTPSFSFTKKQTGWVQVDVRNDVKEWISSDVANWGWVFINDDAEKWSIKSSEYSDGFFRPKLSLTLKCSSNGGSTPSPPPPPPTRQPTREPTNDPTSEPTSDPTREPTSDPTTNPTNNPVSDPTNGPTPDIPVGQPPGGGGDEDSDGDGLPDGVPPGIVAPPLGPAPGGRTLTSNQNVPAKPPASRRRSS